MTVSKICQQQIHRDISHTMQSILTSLILISSVLTLKDEELTFPTSDSFVVVVGYEGSYNMNMSLQVKTWQGEGVLVFHKFSSVGHLKIFLQEGHLVAEIVSEEEDGPMTTIKHYNTLLSDGSWHYVRFYIDKTGVGLVVDNNQVADTLPSLIRTGENTVLQLGGTHGHLQFEKKSLKLLDF